MSPAWNQSRGGSGGPKPYSSQSGSSPSVAALFDPQKTEQELYDSLAEQQAEQLEPINSSQLRKFFGEIKDLYRQFDSLTATANDADKDRIYREKIEARFKMVRSKVAYAERPSARLAKSFAGFLKHGIKQVQNGRDFTRFVHHFEAVVGFMYGLEKVRKD